MVALSRWLLAVALLLQGRTSQGELNCATLPFNLETFRCVAVGERGNQILRQVKQSNRVDTTVLSSFQSYDWSRIRTFILRDSKLLSISPDLFQYAVNLNNLDLTNNPNLCFTGEEFKHLTNLQTLRLSATGRCPGTSLLSKLSNLHSLDLSNLNAGIDFFGLRDLSPFPRLQILDLSRNQQINFNAFNVGSALTSLNASQTRVTLGSGCFANALELKKIYMSHSEISNLPRDTFAGSGVTHLDLSYNSIKTAGIHCLTGTMVYVNMSHNNLGDLYFPGIIPQSLETLDLSYNNISVLHVEIFEFANKLKYINLAHNQFAWLFEKIFADMSTIEELDLSFNILYNFHDFVFTDLTNLKVLNLAGNLLHSLDNDLLKSNTRLENLYLQNNLLDSLNILTFASLRQLKSLDLRNNRLTRLPDDLLNVGNLKTFLVSCNRLTYLPASFFKGKLGTTVSLHGNPWKCTCLVPIVAAMQVYELRLEEKYFNSGDYPTCYVGYNNDYGCNDNTLSEEDYSTWEREVRFTEIQC